MSTIRSEADTALPRGFTPPCVMTHLSEDETVLLAFSGGADSSALLDMLLGIGCRVECAHLEHGIRGETSERDARFCVERAGVLGVPIHVERVDVPRVAKERGEGLEEAARRERYEFFSRVMRERGIRLLITAHNADDQLETLLLRLTRGSGARGMCGIPPIRELGEGRLVLRPMLGVSKSEVLEYCDARGIPYVTDETNDDVEYSRNRIRARVIPELRRINPAVAAAAGRLANGAREDCEYLDSLADGFLSDLENGETPTCELSALARPISRRVMEKLYARAGGVMLEEKHYAELFKLLTDAPRCHRERRLSLPAGVCAVITHDRLKFVSSTEAERMTAEKEELPAGENFSLFDGENLLPGGSTVTIGANIGEKLENINFVYKVSTKTLLNTDKIKGNLYARRRAAGDVILHGGMHKSIKKLFCDRGIVPDARVVLPLICDDDGVVYVPFIGVRDGMAYDGTGECTSVMVALPTERYIKSQRIEG